MSLTPAQVPPDYPRSLRERYFLMAFVLRRGNNTPQTQATMLDGLRGLKAGLDSELVSRRVDAIINELEPKASAA